MLECEVRYMKVPLEPRKCPSSMLPLMDMIFLLLVVFIFMIVQTRPDFGVSVELPEIGKRYLDPVTDRKKAMVTLSMTADSQLYVNDHAVTESSLFNQIQHVAGGASAEDIRIILKGDRRLPYEEMLKVFTLLERYGLNEIVFDVEPGEGG